MVPRRFTDHLPALAVKSILCLVACLRGRRSTNHRGRLPPPRLSTSAPLSRQVPTRNVPKNLLDVPPPPPRCRFHRSSPVRCGRPRRRPELCPRRLATRQKPGESKKAAPYIQVRELAIRCDGFSRPDASTMGTEVVPTTGRMRHLEDFARASS